MDIQDPQDLMVCLVRRVIQVWQALVILAPVVSLVPLGHQALV